MKTYITRTGQNIYDVALQLYGSIEGVIDVIVSNNSLKITDYGPEEVEGQPLSFSTKLSRGIVLNYHDSVVVNDKIADFISDKNIIPANGEHTCNSCNYYDKDKRIIIHQSGILSAISGKVYSGTLYVDWGDFSDVEIKKNTDGQFTIEHAYHYSENHNIVIMGDFVMNNLDLSGCNGVAYALNKVVVKNEFTNNNNNTALNTLFVSE